MKALKRLLCLCMAVCLAVGLSVPAFAAENRERRGMHCVYDAIGESGGHLNLAGEGPAVTNRNVTVYSRTTNDDQVWYPDVSASHQGQKFFSAKSSNDGRRYALNINNSTGNCNIYPDIQGNDRDSLIGISENVNDPHLHISIVLADAFHGMKQLSVSGTNVVWVVAEEPIRWTRCA